MSEFCKCPFLDLTGFPGPDLSAYGREIVATVRQWTGIPVSLGIASTKTLAKVANRLAKQGSAPGGVFDLTDPDQQTQCLAGVDVQDLWGIGSRWVGKLKACGIHTALQLRDADPRWLQGRFSVVMGRIILELRGIACLDLEEIPEPRKQIMASRSFGHKVTALQDLKEAVASHVARAAEKLRRQDLLTQALMVSIHTSRFSQTDAFYSKTCTLSLPVPTSDTGKLIQQALRGLEALYREGFLYQKVGIMLMDLMPAGQYQPGLFDQGDDARSRQRMATLDRINRVMGRGTLRYASEGLARPWAMRSGRRSPAYTTRWQDLPRV